MDGHLEVIIGCTQRTTTGCKNEVNLHETSGLASEIKLNRTDTTLDQSLEVQVVSNGADKLSQLGITNQKAKRAGGEKKKRPKSVREGLNKYSGKGSVRLPLIVRAGSSGQAEPAESEVRRYLLIARANADFSLARNYVLSTGFQILQFQRQNSKQISKYQGRHFPGWIFNAPDAGSCTAPNVPTLARTETRCHFPTCRSLHD